MRGLLGIDLDNTIIDYAPAYASIAEEFGLAPSVRDRRSIRAVLRPSDSNDDEWQRFQSVLYTEGLSAAVPSVGVLAFLDRARDLGWRIAIVSHKTERTQERFGGLLMREAATQWLIDHGVIPSRCLREYLHYESTQREKIARITRLGCDVFVDDLDAVVFHRDRPGFTQMVHYVPDSKWVESPHRGVAGQGDFTAISEWIRQC